MSQSHNRIRTIADAGLIKLPRHARGDNALVVAEGGTGVPFAIARMFTLSAQAGRVRGNHAHRRCSQFMLCVSGAVDVTLDDGTAHKTYTLMRDNEALLVPPMLWAVVIFVEPQSILTVLCDRPYEADDYIQDYAAYLDAQKALVR